MLRRRGFSLAVLLVVNPAVILLYQNCSFLPVTESQVASRNLMPQKRAISSIAIPEKIDPNKLIRVAAPSSPTCKNKSGLGNCLISNE